MADDKQDVVARSQVYYRYLPGALYNTNHMWFMIESLGLHEFTSSQNHMLDIVHEYVRDWSANKDLSTELFPSRDDQYYFGEVTQVNYTLFPLVFRCNNTECQNTHTYRDLRHLLDQNPNLRCEFCDTGRLTQYQYALIHRSGDIQPLRVKLNPGHSWKDRHSGIRMKDTRRFATATWYNSRTHKSLGTLGTTRTTLPVEPGTPGNEMFMSGTVLGDGEIFYPALVSFVNLKQETLEKRKENTLFAHIQLAALLGFEEIDGKNYTANFERTKNSDILQDLLTKATGREKEILLGLLERENMNPNTAQDNMVSRLESLFPQGIPVEKVNQDRMLHEFVFSWYENEGTSLEDRLEDCRLRNDAVQEHIVSEAIIAARNIGVESVALLEKLPVLTLGIGFTRKSLNRNEAILRPFTQRINGDRERIVIPILRNDNEALIFKLDPLRILAWLSANRFISLDDRNINNAQSAHAFLYEILYFDGIPVEDLSRLTLSDTTDQRLVGTIMAFRLLHTFMHVLLQSGKSVLGLDVDSMSEYLFPSALTGVIYVSKLQGGGMGNLIAAFDSDLERWLRNAYDKANTCLYDPVCREHKGACHACQYLKFSCRYFNHGLSRNLLIGGIIDDWNSLEPVVGFYSSKVDHLINEWRIGR